MEKTEPMSAHQKAQTHLAHFWYVIKHEPDGVTVMAELYRRETEALFTRLDAAEKERDDFRAKLNQRYLDAAATTAWQRRDMTLTAELHNILKFYAGSCDCNVGWRPQDQTWTHSKTCSGNRARELLERWSREGKVEPPYSRCDSCGSICGTHSVGCSNETEPPAPDLGEIAFHKLHQIAGSNEARDVLVSLRAFWLFDIDAKLAAREEK